MLRLAARYADMVNGPCTYPDRLAPLHAAVDAACAAVGRDPATLALSAAVLVDFTDGRGIPSSFNSARLPPLSGMPSEIASTLRGFAAGGVTHIQITPIPMTIESVEKLAPVLESMRPGDTPA
jgi:alkanesulfonate monooxygenase SsuD/methylene tetrahydromethanopterin reductase-like flavin-dependent oxidoreductase (luciferase family)